MVSHHLKRLTIAGTLTGRQGQMTGDTHPSFLPVHVDQLALHAAAGGTEHLRATETHVLNSRSASQHG